MDNKDLNDRAVKFMKSFENGGPAAQRFYSSVQSLLNEIQRCGSNASLGREEIADLEEQLIHLKELNANKKISTAIENEKKAMQDEVNISYRRIRLTIFDKFSKFRQHIYSFYPHSDLIF